MVEKKNVNATGIALALTFGIVSIICLFLILIAPTFTISLFSSLMHGVDLTQITMTPSISGKTLLGLIVVLVGGYLIGIVFAMLYNRLAKKRL